MDSTHELGTPVLLILCGILGMLLLAIAIIVFFLVYQKRLFAQRESMQRMEADHQKDMLRYSFEAQEAERKRIAYDLHDDLGSALSALRIYIKQMDPSVPAEAYNDLKNETAQLIDKVIDTIRVITLDLYPPNLDHLNFVQACNNLFQRVQKMSKIEVHFEYNVLPVLTNREELYCYRILQELIENTIKHAQATMIHVVFESDFNGFELNYEDNGVGFDPEEIKKAPSGLGIKSIVSRSNTLNAAIEINTQKNEGFLFKMALKTKHESEGVRNEVKVMER
ncbi:MAG: ATP-binding protein [Bacteroidota bacterium]